MSYAAGMERKLDRLVSFDEKSRAFPIRALVAGNPPRSYTWRRGPIVLDQGNEGACVGFSISGELAARPRMVQGVTNATAFTLYKAAQTLDEWPGEDYDGTSVLAGLKAAQAQGYYTGYRWAFGLSDLILAVGYKGPAVLGINWRDSMWDPNAAGVLDCSGKVVGGHAILCRGVSVRLNQFRLTNSWGPDWGFGGDAFVSFDDMDSLLHDQGEAAIPVRA